MKTHFNWGIIGLGTIANDWAKNFQNNEQHTLYAVSSRSLEKAQAFCQKYNIPKAYVNDEIFEDSNIDIIYIATPHNFHYEQIKKALLADKHVFCEKAITLNAYELKEVMQIAKERHLTLLEGTTLFYMPLSKEIKNRIQSKEYGKLKMMQVNFGSYKPYDPNNRFFNPDLAGGALLDIGVYAIAACVYYLNSKPKLLATSMVKTDTGVDESSIMLFSNDNNELATVNLTFRAKMPKRCLIAMEEGYFEIDNYPRADKAIFTTPTGESETIFTGESDKVFQYEQNIMEDLIMSDEKNEYIELSLIVMEIMDKCRKLWMREND